MHIDTIPNRNSRPAYLLRESVREGKRVRKRTLANLSSLPIEQIEAIRRILRGEKLGPVEDGLEVVRSRAHGHVEAVLGAMRRLGFDKLIDAKASRERTLVAAMVAERILAPEASKLGMTRAWADTTLRAFNKLGQGGQVLTPLAVVVAFFLARARHTVRPFLLVAGAFALTYVTIGPLKVWTDRLAASEHVHAHPEYLFYAGEGLSYPSGHVVNAIVWYGVLATLLTGALRPRLVAAIRYTIPLVLLFTTTYLSFHWITDGLAALLLGLLLDRLLRRAPWDAIPLGARLTRSGWAGPFYDTH